MKSFLQEYGFAILTAIVVIVLLAMTTPVRNIIKSAISNTIETQASSVESKMASGIAIDGMEVTIQQISNTKLRIMVKSNSTTDQFLAQYRYASKKGMLGGYSDPEPWTAFGGFIGDNTHGEYHIAHTTDETPMNVPVGAKVQVRAKDIGKNKDLWAESNIII